MHLTHLLNVANLPLFDGQSKGAAPANDATKKKIRSTQDDATSIHNNTSAALLNSWPAFKETAHACRVIDRLVNRRSYLLNTPRKLH